MPGDTVSVLARRAPGSSATRRMPVNGCWRMAWSMIANSRRGRCATCRGLVAAMTKALNNRGQGAILQVARYSKMPVADDFNLELVYALLFQLQPHFIGAVGGQQ